MVVEVTVLCLLREVESNPRLECGELGIESIAVEGADDSCPLAEWERLVAAEWCLGWLEDGADALTLR